MIFQIEPKTRQWLGLLIVSGFVIAMIWTGKIPVTVYRHWEGLLVGALFYHVIRMLNGPTSTPDKPLQPMFLPQMSLAPNHIPDAGNMVPPTQSPEGN